VPFTLSHPAAAAVVWPLVRRGTLPLAAVTIGAMSPDFEFFLHLRPVARWSHSLAGLVGFCLPVGLLVYGVWELAMRGPTRHLLGLDAVPEARRPRLEAGWVLRAAAAVLLGAATHLVWDGFTHGGYWGAQIVPALRGGALSFGGRVIPWFNLFQHVSTAVGGLVVLAWLRGQLRRGDSPSALLRPTWRWAVLAGMLAASLLAALLNGTRGPAPSDYWSTQLWLGRAAVGAMLGFGVALSAYGAARTLGRFTSEARAI
jgi:hypothetical protein